MSIGDVTCVHIGDAKALGVVVLNKQPIRVGIETPYEKIKYTRQVTTVGLSIKITTTGNLTASVVVPLSTFLCILAAAASISTERLHQFHPTDKRWLLILHVLMHIVIFEASVGFCWICAAGCLFYIGVMSCKSETECSRRHIYQEIYWFTRGVARILFLYC